MIAVAQIVQAVDLTALLALSIKEAEDLDASNPLRHFFASGGSSGRRTPKQADHALLPSQPPSISRQTTQLAFGREALNGRLPIPISLAVDASPGCGGIAWPAGQVNAFRLLRYQMLAKFLPRVQSGRS